MVFNEVESHHVIKSVFVEHLSNGLKNEKKIYFQEDKIDRFSRIQGPFRAKAPSDYTSTEEENFIELYYNSAPKRKFGSLIVISFWI